MMLITKFLAAISFERLKSTFMGHVTPISCRYLHLCVLFAVKRACGKHVVRICHSYVCYVCYVHTEQSTVWFLLLYRFEGSCQDSKTFCQPVRHLINAQLARLWYVYTLHKNSENYIIFWGQVLRRYREEGFEFLLKAFNTPNFLEDLTGLSQLYAETEDDQVFHKDSKLHYHKGQLGSQTPLPEGATGIPNSTT